jgi:hypothetical protein
MFTQQLVEQSVRASSTNRGQMGPADATWHITPDPRVEIGKSMAVDVKLSGLIILLIQTDKLAA